jgi:hypothetical protein
MHILGVARPQPCASTVPRGAWPRDWSSTGAEQPCWSFGCCLRSRCPLQACPARVTPESPGFDDLSSRCPIFPPSSRISYFLVLPPSFSYMGCGCTHCRVWDKPRTASDQQLYGKGSLPIKLQGWRFSPCKRLVKDFSLEEEIHILFAQRLESGPRNFIPSSGQPNWDRVRVSQVARGF